MPSGEIDLLIVIGMTVLGIALLLWAESYRRPR